MRSRHTWVLIVDSHFTRFPSVLGVTRRKIYSRIAVEVTDYYTEPQRAYPGHSDLVLTLSYRGVKGLPRVSAAQHHPRRSSGSDDVFSDDQVGMPVGVEVARGN